ncbi:terminase [Bradyrhizobium sp. Pa8]|uniref:terminase n=1 Tax=Bradyrhizobium sp. Pa8 TaxID=3386552 RepID=UPI00403F2A1A
MHDERPDALRVHLWPKQWTAFLTEATEVLFGGAAGPGKSHLMRVAAIVWCSSIAGLQVYLFRRVREDLYKNHLEGPKGFRAMLAPLVHGGWCRIIGDEIRFWNGSRIYLCHCKAENDVYKYQGAEIHVLLIDELTHFSEAQYRFLRNRVRMVGITLPPEYVGKFPRILCGSNPGNTGHLWVKTTFITGTMPLTIRRMPPSEGGMLRQFIPARLEDNPSMAKDDPSYTDRLAGLGSASLVKAMKDGDWDVVEGAFFDEWSNPQHVVAPFTLPRHWLRFRSGDWGSYSPFSIGWWAVVGDDYRLPVVGHGDQSDLSERSDHRGGRSGGLHAGLAVDGGRARSNLLPRGALVRYREDYGAKGGKLTAEQVGARIVKLEKDDPKLSYGVLDPSTFKEDGGPSIAERINQVLIKEKLVPFREADNTRVSRAESRDRGGPMSGWDGMRARLIGTAKRREDGAVDWSAGRPMLYVFATCVDFIRTVPVLQHDAARPEDLDTTGEDHAADDGRYACTSRPWVKSLTPAQKESRDAYGESREERYSDDTATL